MDAFPLSMAHNVGIAIMNHPRVITIFMGGIPTIKNGCFMAFLYPQYWRIPISPSISILEYTVYMVDTNTCIYMDNIWIIHGSYTDTLW